MKIKTLITLIALFIAIAAPAQRGRAQAAQQEGYNFTTVTSLDATSVKNQARTGTCWCFATTSFIESELMRMGKGEFDLSEMFVVRHNYMDRLKDNYLRRGKGNLGPGSLAHDWMRVFANDGIVPDAAYSGLVNGNTAHNHGELQAMLSAIAEIPVKSRNESNEYYSVVNAVL
ncbi:MAG: C1 family peptidase, partial [Bacteroidales bacterium]